MLFATRTCLNFALNTLACSAYRKLHTVQARAGAPCCSCRNSMPHATDGEVDYIADAWIGNDNVDFPVTYEAKQFTKRRSTELLT
jgi:hypothetical protein